MKYIKNFSQLFESSFSDELKASEILDLIAMGADNGTVTEVWIQEFDQYYNSPLQMMLMNKQKEKLRKEYITGNFSWTFRNYEGEYDGNEDLLASMKDKDKKDLDKLKNMGWEIYFTDVDGETPQDAWFYYLLRKPAEKPISSEETKKWIMKNHPNPSQVKVLSTFLNPKDAHEIRGAVSGSLYNV